MKIAMIGCGAAGSCFAGYLRKGGADITLVDRYQAHMDKVAKDGLEFIVYPDTHYHLDGFKTAYTADDIGIMDIVIFVTKATQLESAVQSAMPCCGSGALGTQLREPGCCVSTEVQGTLVHFGALENGPVTDKAGKHLAEVFTKGGCRAEFNEDDRPNIWKKVIINCTVNTVCALLRLKIYEVAEDPYGMELFRGVVREACAIATAKGVPFDAVEFENTHLKNFIDNMGDYYPSMAQDMLINHRQTEIEVLNGKLSEYGKQFGIPTPVNDVLVIMVKAIQANYDKQYLK